MLLNKKFGISVDYTEDNGVKYNVHFRDRNNYEFHSYVGEEQDFQNDINDDIEYLTNANTIEDIIYFIGGYCAHETKQMKYGPDYSNDDEPIVQFGNDKEYWNIKIYY